jgi:hypothetical protein
MAKRVRTNPLTKKGHKSLTSAEYSFTESYAELFEYFDKNTSTNKDKILLYIKSSLEIAKKYLKDKNVPCEDKMYTITSDTHGKILIDGEISNATMDPLSNYTAVTGTVKTWDPSRYFTHIPAVLQTWNAIHHLKQAREFVKKNEYSSALIEVIHANQDMVYLIIAEFEDPYIAKKKGQLESDEVNKYIYKRWNEISKKSETKPIKDKVAVFIMEELHSRKTPRKLSYVRDKLKPAQLIKTKEKYKL